MCESDKSVLKMLDAVCDQFEKDWNEQSHLELSSYLEQVDQAHQEKLLGLLLELDIELRQKNGVSVQPDDYVKLGDKAISLARNCLEEGTEGHETQPLQQRGSSSKPVALTGPTVGDRIGAYTLVRMLGEGGMGAVWLAKQQEPVSRQVALKLIRPGIGSKETIARFQSERQALAMMDHPNIASIYDAGTTSQGAPYFVMELVEGVPLTEFCDQENLSIADRLNLFIEICAGVQHAHQKGIIHRDLKPGNILVARQDGKAVPKVIDFGLAKAIDDNQKLTDQSLFTGIGQILGTLKYMSPEQAGMEKNAIDTKTDIYALGVILYELLTGMTPLDSSSIKDEALLKVLELIRDHEPKKPSSKLGSSTNEQISTIISRRKIERSRLNRVLTRDLDWIVMKAIEKNPDRRYETAAGFSNDIQRYLNFEPVIARPPSVGYKLRKFVKKNAGLVASVIVAVVLLIAGIVGTSVGLYHAENARQEADDRATELQTIVDFQRERLSSINPQKVGSNLFRQLLTRVDQSQEDEIQRILAPVNFTSIAQDFLYTNIFEVALERIETEFEKHPLLKAKMLETTGETMSELGILQPAVAPLNQAIQLYREELGPNAVETLELMDVLGNLYVELRDVEQGEQLLQQVLSLRQLHFPNDQDGILKAKNNLASLALANEEFAKAEEGYSSVLKDALTHFGTEDERTATAYANVGLAQSKQGNFEAATENLNTALDLREKLLGTSDPDYLTSLNNFGMLKLRSSDFEQAAEILEKAKDLSGQVLGDEHPTTLLALNNYGSCLTKLKKYEEANTVLETTLRGRKKVLGKYHPYTASTLNNISYNFFQANRPKLALEASRKSVEKIVVAVGHVHPTSVTYIDNLIHIATHLKEHSLIRDTLLPYERLDQQAFGEMPPHVQANLFLELGKARTHLDDIEEFMLAEANIKKAISLGGPSKKSQLEGTLALVALFEKWHEKDKDGGFQEKARILKKQIEQSR